MWPAASLSAASGGLEPFGLGGRYNAPSASSLSINSGRTSVPVAHAPSGWATSPHSTSGNHARTARGIRAGTDIRDRGSIGRLRSRSSPIEGHRGNRASRSAEDDDLVTPVVRPHMSCGKKLDPAYGDRDARSVNAPREGRPHKVSPVH